MGYSLTDILNHRHSVGRHIGAQDQRARQDEPAPDSRKIAVKRPEPEAARRAPRTQPSAPRPATLASPPAPPPRRALSDRELYQTWLRLTLTSDTPAIVEWPYIYLAARGLGLTRLGHGNYRPEQWRKAVQRLVRDGGAVPFWWRTKGRPPRVLTTQQHLAAWAIAGYHARLGRRRRT